MVLEIVSDVVKNAGSWRTLGLGSFIQVVVVGSEVGIAALKRLVVKLLNSCLSQLTDRHIYYWCINKK